MNKESFEYKGCYILHMTEDNLWYVIKNNKIVYWHKHYNDIKSWIDNNDVIEYMIQNKEGK
jgi:hypothetical protein